MLLSLKTQTQSPVSVSVGTAPTLALARPSPSFTGTTVPEIDIQSLMEALGVSGVDPDEPLMERGMNSMLAVQFHAQLS